jgi:hypothetical protein
MADNTARYGFRWVRSLTGPSAPPIQAMRVASAYTASPGGTDVDLNVGDPVELLSTGYCQLVTASSGVIYGVIAGIAPYWDGSKMTFGTKLPKGTTYGSVQERTSWIYVIPVQNQVFEVDVDDASTATTEAGYLALVGENADHAYSASSTTLRATPKIDISTHATTNTLQWRIVDIAKRIPNLDFSGANMKIEVTANVVRQAPYQTTGV